MEWQQMYFREHRKTEMSAICTDASQQCPLGCSRANVCANAFEPQMHWLFIDSHNQL